jgi:hypothetical protein
MHQLRMSPLRLFSGWTKIPSSLPDFFFFSTSSLPQNFPPSYLPPTSPRPTYHLPPPSYLPPTSPLLPTTYHPHPPLTPSPELQRPRAAVEWELELWLWSWSGWSWSGVAGVGTELLELEQDPRAHEKVRSLACLLQWSKLRSQAPELALLCYNPEEP